MTNYIIDSRSLSSGMRNLVGWWVEMFRRHFLAPSSG